MYCDSAYFYDKQNSLYAFGNVHLIQGDSIEGFGDKLHYNGNTKIAKFRKHVKLIHNGTTTLRTDSMDYDRMQDVAYYFSGGTIEDTVNILKSIRGRYTPSNNQAIFSGEVELVHPKYTLTTDTLW
jgi:lipopolysaccharide export system protein LptA